MKNLRVFHGLVNYGTQAGYIASGLRLIDVNAKSYTMMDTYKRQTDFSFKQRHNIIAKMFYYMIWYPLVKTWCIFKFDIFHFYYGTSLWSSHLDLPIIKLLGKKIVHHYLGHDVELYKETIEKYEFINMVFWADDIKGNKHDASVKKRFNYENYYSDFQIVCAPQYSQFVPAATFIPLAIDLSKYVSIDFGIKDYNIEPVIIVHAPTHRGVKGTQFLETAVKKLQEEGYMVELKIYEGITHEQLLEAYKEADFTVSGLLGGWFGTSAIESMASGRGVISFLREEYFKYVDEEYKNDLPIVNANRDTIYDVLKYCLLNRNFKEWSKKSRLFVEKHHDMKKVAVRVKKIYDSIL